MSWKTLVQTVQAKAQGVPIVAVAMTGSLETSLVAYAAKEVMGNKCVGVTVQSELTAPQNFTFAVEAAEFIGLEHHPLAMRLLENDNIRRNGDDRCYHCNRAIYRLMRYEYGDQCLLMDGLAGGESGKLQKVNVEFEVFSPLLEASLTRSEAIALANEKGLPGLNHTGMECLADRLPQGVLLTKEALEMVTTMEQFFIHHGVKTVRVSHDNLMATVEYPAEVADIMDKLRDKFASLFKRLDLERYVFKVI